MAAGERRGVVGESGSGKSQTTRYMADILRSVKTIAMVGASNDKTKFSYGVLRVLHETGYEMLPVNPDPRLTEIRGIRVYHSLEEIDRPVDMVEVFRRPEKRHVMLTDLLQIVTQARHVDSRLAANSNGMRYFSDLELTDRQMQRK